MSIPEEHIESESMIAKFCSEHCESIPLTSNLTGFQVIQDQSSQDMRCECLVGTDEVTQLIDEGTGKYLQCFKYSPPHLEGYHFIGAGRCRDVENNSYDYIEHIFDFYNSMSLEDCGNICLQLTTNDLAGFYYASWESNYVKGTCDCLFADGQIPFQPKNAISAHYESLGNGAIAGTCCNSDNSFRCFSYFGNKYHDEGGGLCIDSNNATYGWISYIIKSLQDCKELCFSISSHYLGLQYRQQSRECFCLYNQGHVPTQPSTGGSDGYFHGRARGEITHSTDDLSLRDVCYSHDGYLTKVF